MTLLNRLKRFNFMNSTMQSCSRMVSIALLSLFALGCNGKSDHEEQGGAPSASSEFSVTGVNEYDFLFNDSDAGGMINFVSASLKQCSLSFIKANFVEGYSTRTEKLGGGDIDLTCLGEKTHFALNESGETFVEMKVDDVDSQATVTISFSLYSIITKEALTRNNVKLTVTAAQLNTLLN